MANVRVGFIGCGGIANGKHFPGMAQQEGVDMCAFCDLILERAEKAAKEYGTPDAKVYTDYHELLADPTIDAVHVLTPNVAHCEITVAALEAGKHVLCEKPMAATPADAKKMLEARDRTGKMLTIGYQYRHFPENQVAKKVVDSGALGDVYYAEATYLRRRGVPTWGVFTDKAKQGGGPLIDLGVHVIDLSRYLCGNPKPVTVFGATFSKLGARKNLKSVVLPWESTSDVKKKEYKFDVEDFVTAMIRFDNGLLVTAEASFSLNIEKDTGNVELLGTKAGLTLSPFVLHTECNDMLADTVIRANIGEGDFFRAEMENFVNAIEGIAPCKAPAEDGVELMRILDAIYESAETGKSVDIVR